MLCVSWLAIVASANTATGHGEDKPGPHGGEIRMPGAFHTELVWAGPRRVKVYLLDMNYKEPLTMKSSVSVTVNPKSGEPVEASCKTSGTAFTCSWSKGPTRRDFASLLLTAERNGLKSVGPATYTPAAEHKHDHGAGHSHSH
jgi:hypothetical protein